MTEHDEGSGPRGAARDAVERDDAELMQRTHRAFARDSEALDEITTRRLAAARRAALGQLEGEREAERALARSGRLGWAPVGAAAVVAIAAVGVALTLRPAPDASNDVAVDQPATELELLLGEDDPALYDEDPEFLGWAVDAASAAADGGTGGDDAG